MCVCVCVCVCACVVALNEKPPPPMLLVVVVLVVLLLLLLVRALNGAQTGYHWRTQDTQSQTLAPRLSFEAFKNFTHGHARDHDHDQRHAHAQGPTTAPAGRLRSAAKRNQPQE